MNKMMTVEYYDMYRSQPDVDGLVTKIACNAIVVR